MRVLYLCGAGNSEGVRLAQRVNEQRPRWDRIVLLDDDPAKWGHRILGVEVAGPFGLLEEARDGSEVVNLVARTTAGRRAAHARIAAHGLPFAPLIHPTVDLSGAQTGRDALVYQNATLGPESVLGEGSVVFMGGIVGHESRVGRFCVVAANAVLNARVVLEDGVYVGSNASVLPELSIGTEATIGAGTMVAQNVAAGATVLGVPGKALPLRPRRQAEAVAPPAAEGRDEPRAPARASG